MTIMRTLSLAALVSLSSPAFSLEVPAPGPLDSRVRFVDYKTAEVVQLVGHYGYSTHVQFDPSESITKIALGDPHAWELAPIDNHLFIKPTAEDAATNMTIVTSQRVYNFELSAHWSGNGAHPRPNDMLFQVNFRYPEQEAARMAAEAEAARLRDKLNQKEPTPAFNWNYWGKGSQEVTPNSAYDDQRFTYLKFANNREMPAVYVVNPDGSESLVNTSIDPTQPDTIVVHKIARQFVLRKGNSVACVFNESFDANGITNTAGTTIPGVERVIRGEQ